MNLLSGKRWAPLQDRGPLRVMFVITSMPVGGAETLLVNLIHRMDRRQFLPQVCCLKDRGPLGEELMQHVTVHANLTASKFDFRVLPRLIRLMKGERIDAVVTVGAGDKMFWGRLAAKQAGVPVILSALHSTGWPDEVGRLNHLLTSITDGFIAVAENHRQFMIESSRFPADSVHAIPNGIDVDRFAMDSVARASIRRELAIPRDAPVCGIVAALRPEKNHPLFLAAAKKVLASCPDAFFLVVGDGPIRPELEERVAGSTLTSRVKFLGTRSDIPQILSAIDLFSLTSDNEASPVSILEAMAVGLPVVATDVGSVSETVVHQRTGLLTPTGDIDAVAAAWIEILSKPQRGKRMGQAGRERVVRCASLEIMVEGYEQLIQQIYCHKVDSSHDLLFPSSSVEVVEPLH